MDCLFCKIIKGEIPSYKIFESEKVYAFLDISEKPEGHILVIPKNHSTNTLDCNEEDLCEVIKACKIISNHLVQNCGYNGIDIINANNECAEQSVFHTHYHIIPRKINDDEIVFPENLKKSTISLKELCEKLKLD